MAPHCLWGTGPRVTFQARSGLAPALRSWFICSVASLLLLTFCLVLPTTESRILKSLTIIVELSISSLISVSFDSCVLVLRY